MISVRSHITRLKNTLPALDTSSSQTTNNSNNNTSSSRSSESTSQPSWHGTSTSASEWSFMWEVKWIAIKGLWIVWLVIFTFILRKFFKYLFEFLYDVVNATRMVYMKVLQTRQDTKSDREVEKELAKDMKEKISRMSQVYNNLHKLGKLWVWDKLLSWIFNKPKVVLSYHYEDWILNFIVGTYPEYKAILEGAIAAQYSNSSVETITKPRYFSKKHTEIIPLEPTREQAYPIRTFKTMPDDPINNIIDAIAKVNRYDTISIVMPLKPAWQAFNDRARLLVDAIYRKDKTWINQNAWREYILMPRKVLDFFIHGPSKELLYDNDDWSQWDKMVRMVKAEEDAVNAMWEEAALPAFVSWLMLISSSDVQANAESNVDTLITAFNIFNSEYTNKLDAPHVKADIFWFLFKPLRKFACNFVMPHFFYSKNTFTLNALASIFHLPDWMYNRSPVISWMDYKMLPAPDNLPVLKDFNGFIMSWMLAETYMGGRLSDILKDSPHRAVGKKEEKVDTWSPIENFSSSELEWKDIKEENWRKFVKTFKTKTVRWYKLYKEWVLLWINIYRNKYSPIYFQRDDRTRHHYCIGKSGTWKSVYIQWVARQDIWNGDGICVIDPHGDLAEDMLEYIPKERAKDVIFFDAWNEDRPMGLNLYEIDHPDQADRTVNDATEIFMKMFWPEIFGPRIQEYFKYGSLTILEDFDDKPTLLDVPRLFTDETYREFKTKKVKNAVVKNFREKTYNSMWDREKQEIIPYFTSKFVSFNTNRLIRNIIGQTKSAIRFKDAMDNQKIVLVSLSKGKIWEINAQLLGMIMVSQIYNAAMGRASMAKEDRKDFMLYVDEFQNFVSWTFADILSEARKYRLCLIMAHQYIAQLESWKQEWWKADVKAAVFGNCWTLQSFKVWAWDAEFLEKEYAPVLWAQDIVWIANYKAYIKLNINNTTTRVFSMNAIYTTDYRNKKLSAILKEYSAKKYWRKRKFVDAEIAARLWIWGDEEPAWETETK